jgi:hypothetical protein
VTIDAYRNLHRHCISVKEGRPKRVRRHVQELALVDVMFVVSEAGRQRVLREKRKNVHAVVRGHATDHGPPAGVPVEVSYNPYQHATFVTRVGKKPIYRASYVIVRSTGVTAYV